MAEPATPAANAGSSSNPPKQPHVDVGLSLDLPGKFGSGWTVAGTDVRGNVILTRPAGEGLNTMTVPPATYEAVSKLRANVANKAKHKAHKRFFQINETIVSGGSAMNVAGYDGAGHRALVTGVVNGVPVQRWVEADTVNKAKFGGEAGMGSLLSELGMQGEKPKQEPTKEKKQREPRGRGASKKETTPGGVPAAGEPVEVAKPATQGAASAIAPLVEAPPSEQAERIVEEEGEAETVAPEEETIELDEKDIEVVEEAKGEKAQQIAKAAILPPILPTAAAAAVAAGAAAPAAAATAAGAAPEARGTAVPTYAERRGDVKLDRSVRNTLQLMRDQHRSRLAQGVSPLEFELPEGQAPKLGVPGGGAAGGETITIRTTAEGGRIATPSLPGISAPPLAGVAGAAPPIIATVQAGGGVGAGAAGAVAAAGAAALGAFAQNLDNHSRAVLSAGNQELSRLASGIAARQAAQREIESRISEASALKQELEQQWLTVSSQNDPERAARVETLYRQAEADEEGLKQQQVLQIGQMAEVKAESSRLQGLVEKGSAAGGEDAIRQLESRLPPERVKAAEALPVPQAIAPSAAAPVAGAPLAPAAAGLVAPSAPSGPTLPSPAPIRTSVPSIPPRGAARPRPEQGFMQKMGSRFARPIVLAGSLLAGQAFDRGAAAQGGAQGQDSYEKAMTTEGGYENAPPTLSSYGAGAEPEEEGEDVMASDNAERQKMVDQGQQMKATQESLLGPEAEEGGYPETEGGAPTAGRQGRPAAQQPGASPEEAKRAQSMVQQQQASQQAQQAAKAAAGVGQIAGKVQGAQQQAQQVQAAVKKAQMIWRVIEGAEVVTLEGIPLAVLELNIQMLNKFTMKVPLIPPTNLVEDCLTITADCLIMVSAFMYCLVPLVIIGAAAGGVALLLHLI